MINHFKAIDEVDAHDHPFAFTLTILYGDYTEQIFFLNDQGLWSIKTMERKPGNTLQVEATCIHKIIELPQWGESLMSKAPAADFGTKVFLTFRCE